MDWNLIRFGDELAVEKFMFYYLFTSIFCCGSWHPNGAYGFIVIYLFIYFCFLMGEGFAGGDRGKARY